MARKGLQWLSMLDGNPEEHLIMAVITQAAIDARRGDVRACAWLHSSECQCWFDLLGIADGLRARIVALAGESNLVPAA